MNKEEVLGFISESLLYHRVIAVKRAVEMLRNDFLVEQGIIAPVARIQNDLQDLIALLPTACTAEDAITLQESMDVHKVAHAGAAEILLKSPRKPYCRE